MFLLPVVYNETFLKIIIQLQFSDGLIDFSYGNEKKIGNMHLNCQLKVISRSFPRYNVLK